MALLGIWGAKKAGIGETQEKLVNSLKDLVASQSIKIDNLQEDAVDKDHRIKKLEEEVKDLKELTIQQARVITALQVKLKLGGVGNGF